MAASDHLNPTQFYLRAGEPPASGLSRNHATGEVEQGISVYDMHHNAPVTPPEGEWAHTDLQDRLHSSPWYVVRGQEVGVGHDGEPLLKNVEKVGHWHPDLRLVQQVPPSRS